MNLAVFRSRQPKEFQSEVLASSRIAFMGAGSVNSVIAVEFARLGLGSALIVDRPGERLAEHNISRHQCGYADLGQVKAEALARRMSQYYPAGTFEPRPLDVLRDPTELCRLVGDCGLVVAAFDNDPARFAIGAACVEVGVPLVSAGVMENGPLGQVVRYRPGTACLACIYSALGRGPSLGPRREAAVNYENPEDQDSPPLAGLSLDVAQVALVGHRVALAMLLSAHGDASYNLDPEDKWNWLLWVNRPTRELEGVKPLSWRVECLERVADCLVCARACRK